MANREAIDAKIRKGIEELDRGEGIPEDKLEEHLQKQIPRVARIDIVS